SVAAGAQSGIEECKHQFAWDRWNCPERGLQLSTHSSLRSGMCPHPPHPATPPSPPSPAGTPFTPPPHHPHGEMSGLARRSGFKPRTSRVGRESSPPCPRRWRLGLAGPGGVAKSR
ncbi:hypothetical protein CRUP_021317, partial [Coryphaenoides rupestris]